MLLATAQRRVRAPSREPASRDVVFDRDPLMLRLLNILELIAWGAGVAGLVLALVYGKFLLAGTVALIMVSAILRLRRSRQRRKHWE